MTPPDEQTTLTGVPEGYEPEEIDRWMRGELVLTDERLLKQRRQNEKFGNKIPTLGAYADEWAAGLKLAASTIKGYKKIIRNHIKPQLGSIRLDKLTATRIPRRYRDSEKHGRKD